MNEILKRTFLRMNELFGIPKWVQPKADDIFKKAFDFLNRNAREPKKVLFF